ncbi:hypothetical protein G6F37_011367 [Rhizopus arrhizus]|nr:hypothetical protein G6F38_011662 [Rhizopus arrhizus]KAG1149686.1 hypothetical protein G6F37_011367 [Rhizopus arrhizus]
MKEFASRMYASGYNRHLLDLVQGYTTPDSKVSASAVRERHPSPVQRKCVQTVELQIGLKNDVSQRDKRFSDTIPHVARLEDAFLALIKPIPFGLHKVGQFPWLTERDPCSSSSGRRSVTST